MFGVSDLVLRFWVAYSPDMSLPHKQETPSEPHGSRSLVEP